ncbi:MAG: trypsin-like peptidase domain-containing protein [Acidimicrobiales bacterium]
MATTPGSGDEGTPDGEAENPVEVVVLVDGRPAATQRASRKPGGTSEDTPPPPRAAAVEEPPAPGPSGPLSGVPGPPLATRVPLVRERPAVSDPASGSPSGASDRHPPPVAASADSFLRRHFRVPGAVGIIVIVLALAVGTGFVGAYIWASNDAKNVRTTPTPLAVERPPAEAAEVVPTTTTLPDLSADALAAKLRPSVWSVRTFDSAGRPVQGSGFLARAGNQGLLLTSLAVVEASTHLPAPEIVVTGGGYDGKAQLWSWDEEHDLALLVVDRTDDPAPPWLSEPARLKVGAKVFAVGENGVLKPGVVTGLSGQAVDHNIFIDDVLRGGAIVDVKGEVVAVSSAAYTAGGNPTDTAFFGVPIRNSCARVLTCTGAFAGPGTEVPPSSLPNSGTTTPDASDVDVPTTTEP